MAARNTRSWQALPEALARMLSKNLGVALPRLPDAGEHPALAWRRCGLMDVTGLRDGMPRMSPVPLTTLADVALDALRQLSGASLPQNGALLLGERARLLGLKRNGATSPNGSCRLLAASDGFVAINLPRADDWDLVSAMVQQPVGDWEALDRITEAWRQDELVERGRLLGLAIAPDRITDRPVAPFTVERFDITAKRRTSAPLVVDLSALWAGPLAGSLLAMAGARVIKVESRTRPDGARGGNRIFFELLNGTKEQVTFDFRDPADLADLRALVRQADIVIEGSRPRALRELGIDARAEAARGASWLSITGYGRDGEESNWIGFGDDAAVAGGLTSALRTAFGETLFMGDAVADPLSGLLAAVAGWAAWMKGGGQIVSLALTDVVAFACGFGVDVADAAHWQAMALSDDAPFYPLRSQQ